MKDRIEKKSKSLKSAIERYNEYKRFVDCYKSNNNLDAYIEHIRSSTKSLSKNLLEKYDQMIDCYKCGNIEPLLSNLYDRLLAADEYKEKVSNELKVLLREYENKT
jgi:hypothetical protein